MSKRKQEGSVWEAYTFTDKERSELMEKIERYDSSDRSLDTTEPPAKRMKLDDTNNGKMKPLKKRSMLGWVSATKTKSYLLKDQATDWLSLYYDRYGLTSTPLTVEDRVKNKCLLKDASHIDLLFDGGNTFEKKVYEEMSDIYKDDFVLVMDENDMSRYKKATDLWEFIKGKNDIVIDHMKKGVPFIAQAPLINENNMTYGVSDILVRSDYLPALFKSFVVDEELYIPAPALPMKEGKSYHYRVVDCKWTTIVFNVDGITLRNEDRIPAYKGQLAIYTVALGHLQGYIPNYAYIMGKAWRVDKSNIPASQKHLYRGDSAFDRPGVIQYNGRDHEYVSKTKEAIRWYQRVVTEGRDWRYGEDKPTVPEMYPNMNKSFNPEFDVVKEKLADRYGDPTMVWFVGTEHRERAHAKNVYDVRDPRCTLDILGIKENDRGEIIKKILEINRTDQLTDVIRPAIVTNNTFNWQRKSRLDYYVDFETINYNLFVDPMDMNVDKSYYDSDVTFMIGLGFDHDTCVSTFKLLDSLCIDKNRCNYCVHIDKSTGWEFLCLYLTSFKLENEHELFRVFFDFMIVRHELYQNIYGLSKNNRSKLFHWTDAELRFFDRAVSRIRSGIYTESYLNNPALKFDSSSTVKSVQKEICNKITYFDSLIYWVDLCQVFQSEPITIKGCFRFKLKHVGNSMYKHGLISTHWGDGKMANGFKAMLEAIKLYRESSKTSQRMGVTNRDFEEIVEYNEVDCRVMWEIVEYLREKHCIGGKKTDMSD